MVEKGDRVKATRNLRGARFDVSEGTEGTVSYTTVLNMVAVRFDTFPESQLLVESKELIKIATCDNDSNHCNYTPGVSDKCMYHPHDWDKDCGRSYYNGLEVNHSDASTSNNPVNFQ